MIDSKMLFARGMAKTFAILTISAGAMMAQTASDVPAPSTTLNSQFFDHDFVNVFAFANGIYDTALPEVGTNGYGSSFGYDVGGGITAGHSLHDGTFSISYRGDYRHYQESNYANGTNQSLALIFTKRLTRQWSLSTQVNGAVISYGGQFYSESAAPGLLTNPLSSQSRFASAGIFMTYEQTRRLSYTFGGTGFYNNFNYNGAVTSIGGTGTASVNYRTTARTTIGGSYSHTYFSYSGNVGSSQIDSGFLTLQHTFSRAWVVSLSGGVSRSHAQGIIEEPITILLGQQAVSGFIVGPYNRVSISPSFQGSLTYNRRHSLFSLTGGQGVNAGNGTFLTSRAQFVGGTYSITHKKQNLSFGGGYNRLESIANTVSIPYTTATLSASYGFNVVRYISADLRYDFIHYDSLYRLNGLNESRFTFGLNFSSKSIPMTLF